MASRTSILRLEIMRVSAVGERSSLARRMSKMDAISAPRSESDGDDLLRKSAGPRLASPRQSNKNVLRDENDDNDVVVAAAVAQGASPCTSRRAGHVRRLLPSAHIRRPMRPSEHKCSIARD